MEYKFPLVKYINGKQYSSYIYGSKRVIDLDGYFPERSIDSLGLSSSNKNHEFYLFKEDDGHWSCTVRLTLFDIRTILIMLKMFNIITNNGSKIIYTEDKTPEEIITEINNIGLVKINNKIRINNKKVKEVAIMATTKDSIVLMNANNTAKIVLDWDDGQWYVSDIEYTETPNTNTGPSTPSTSTPTTSSNNIKVAVWDQTYKYASKDIVNHDGILYISKQNQNQGNSPNAGKFWWNPVVDLTSIDAITLEGKNLNEIMRTVLGGNVISDYYKKSEIDNNILTYFNNVNAKKLNDWSLQNIKDDYNKLITASEKKSNDFTIDYLNNDKLTGFDQSLVDLFNSNIATDNINKI
jgi:regulation of enolase protein 1 (concanavalin A-like superfamily)